MLEFFAGQIEMFDEENQEFTKSAGTWIRLEHSLVSLSKWESKYQKPFLENNNKTSEEVIDYVAFMLLGQMDAFTLDILTEEDIQRIQSYIESPQSATTFGALPKTQAYRGETVTSELIYYWMVAYNIPFSCEDWHLNRLLSLIRICNVKNSNKKMSKAEIAARNRELNAKRRAELGTSG